MQDSPPVSPMKASQYAELVSQWMGECHRWHSLMYSLPQYYGTPLDHKPSLWMNGTSRQSGNGSVPIQEQLTPPGGAGTQQAAVTTQDRRGEEYRIPPLYKRALAEIVDFLVFFIIKLVITFIAVSHFDLIDMGNYDLEAEFGNWDTVDLSIAVDVMGMTLEVMMLELVLRFLLAIMEAYFITGPRDNPAAPQGAGPLWWRRGGSTPGKALLKLRVVTCEWVAPVPGPGGEERAIIHPAAPLTFGKAFFRSTMKSVFMAVMFPLYMTLFIMHQHHNRTAYDIMAGTIVVEEIQPAPPARAARPAAQN